MKSSVVVLLFLFIPYGRVHAQHKPASEYQLKAAFIYNFTRFIDWPPNAANASDSPFIIGIIGDEPFGAYVEDLVKGEKLGNRPVLVMRFESIKEIRYCNILFIAADDAVKIKDQLPALNRRGILTVSDVPNFVKWGGIIRFFKEDNKLRLQINIDEAKASQILISSKLLSLSTIYRTN